MQHARSRSQLPLALLLLTILVGFMVVPVPPAQAATIGKKIASVSDGDIVAWAMSPDGTTIVYSAWENLSGGDPKLSLFSVSVTGGSSTKLVALVSSCCKEWKIDPLSSKVLYLDTNRNVLFSVPIGGGNTTQVSADGYTVFQFEITPNGERAIFTSAPYDHLGYVSNLYSAVIGGGSPQRLNIGAPLPEGGDIGYFALSNAAGGNWRVVYIADQRFDDVFELFSVPVTPGTVPIRLNPNLTVGGNVHHFWVAPEGQRVAYWADQDTDEVRELYSVLVGGSGNVKLNGTPAPGVPFPVSFVDFNPAGTRVVYMAIDAPGVGNLYSVTVAGESRTKLSDDFTPNSSTPYTYLGAAITSDGQRVVYNADDETAGKLEVFAAWMTGGPLVKLSHDDLSASQSPTERLSPNGWRAPCMSRRRTPGPRCCCGR